MFLIHLSPNRDKQKERLMRIFRNSLIPFRGFQAINICGLIFVRKEFFPLSPIAVNHEKIHTRQMQELAYIPFYALYIAEWIFRSLQKRSFKQGYYSISFEREAYTHQNNLHYLQTRPHWAWLDVI